MMFIHFHVQNRNFCRHRSLRIGFHLQKSQKLVSRKNFPLYSSTHTMYYNGCTMCILYTSTSIIPYFFFKNLASLWQFHFCLTELVKNAKFHTEKQKCQIIRDVCPSAMSMTVSWSKLLCVATMFTRTCGSRVLASYPLHSSVLSLHRHTFG